MMNYNNIRTGFTRTLCVLCLLTPVIGQAASEDELTAMRAQLLALSDRLDRLEAENRSLSNSNAELLQSNQQTAIAEIGRASCRERV